MACGQREFWHVPAHHAASACATAASVPNNPLTRTLTDRVFGILREKNPELTGERRRTVLKPPQVGRGS